MRAKRNASLAPLTINNNKSYGVQGAAGIELIIIIIVIPYNMRVNNSCCYLSRIPCSVSFVWIHCLTHTDAKGTHAHIVTRIRYEQGNIEGKTKPNKRILWKFTSSFAAHFLHQASLQLAGSYPILVPS